MPKTKTVVCAACNHRVPKRECVEYGEQWVCKPCDRELNERDEELWMKDMEDELLRRGLGW